ncbi:MAG: hypothetical protein M5T61_05775 [Acidimicrobiia bacterium]|nr:hypothetical protein [Acidimicrobiia bacterium]
MRLPLAATLLLPGALLVGAGGDLDGPGWVATLVVAATALGGALVGLFDAASLRHLGPPMWTVTVLAVFSTVPDTEEMRVLVGVSVPLALLGVVRGAGLGAGAPAAVGLLVHTAAVGGVGRPSSVIGAVGALGMLVVVPLVTAAGVRAGSHAAGAGRRSPRRAAGAAVEVSPGRREALALLGAHVVVALYAARVAGLVRDPGVAALLLLPATAAAVVAAAEIDGRFRGGRPAWPRRPRRARAPARPPRR